MKINVVANDSQRMSTCYNIPQTLCVDDINELIALEKLSMYVHDIGYWITKYPLTGTQSTVNPLVARNPNPPLLATISC